eukprot:CAMPEP_0204824348 /NCGR_PEP_ID=MMETSP1346-20131115/2371_1 /ASSEMBLY_ACC=CAM_ASM_000771 /TAXON_ID=215587 /ORGANISM="Aplanochytrium stocchinoi, Strain GSBS06" /LENGTH=276 /DNA_ID=CAMNT_0051951443 /DNA_START=246 /DNA_END=1077 /DNA_ORIENTATION=-
MATEWGNELAYDEYFATSHQVDLKEQQAKHLKAEAEFRRLKALKDAELAKKQKLLLDAQLNEKEISIHLQGVNSVGGSISSITTTAALMMGFSATVLIELVVVRANNYPWLVYVMWITAIVTIMVLLNVIFVSTVILSDGVYLAYQGTRGIKDVKKALIGMLSMRAKVLVTFLVAFGLFTVLVLCALLVKLDNESPYGMNGDFTGGDIATGVICTVFWAVSLARTVHMYFETKKKFAMEETEGRTEDPKNMKDGTERKPELGKLDIVHKISTEKTR